jgi:hypothetical protein
LLPIQPASPPMMIQPMMPSPSMVFPSAVVPPWSGE